LPAEQPAEYGGAVPPWCAQPVDCAVRADQGTALTIRDQGILTQHVRPGVLVTPVLYPGDRNRNTASGRPTVFGLARPGQSARYASREEAWRD